VIDAGLLLPLAQHSDFTREPGQGTTSCVGKNDTVCFDWIADNLDTFTTPTAQHVLLVAASVAAGFIVALGLALLSHRRRWLIPPFIGITGTIYTIPSLALFLLLLPLTGRGTDTAIIALSLYNVQILFRNIVAGLANVPQPAREAGRGMGMTDRQLLWRVELPLAVPEIIAGLRIATVSTVAIATLAVFVGAGGLGEVIYERGLQAGVFKTTIVGASAIAVGMAIAFDVAYLSGQRLLSPWRRVRPV
jgi:osmoprotectant transport system permease protein